jgi:hypothetical protein
VLSYYALLALDLANERSREAEELRLVRLARETWDEDRGAYEWLPGPEQGSGLRRGLARATAAVSRGAAAATRRLDDGVAEDLGRTLAVAD